MNILANILLAGLLLLSVSLQRTYHALPVRELKKRAREGDGLAIGLYKAVAYGHSLRAVLWFLVIVTSTAFFVSVATTSPLWVGLLASSIVIWLGFVWLPARKASRAGAKLAQWLAPPLAWLLNYLHPLIDKIAAFIHRHRPVTVHTGLYDRDDLIDLLERQQVQADNRVDRFALQIALNALTFGDKPVRDVLIPRRVVKSVAATDSLGPILMSELHDSGYSRFPVYEGQADNIIGTLFLRDLIDAKQGGTVEHVMRKGVMYLHEEQSLAEALQTILKTRQHLFVVVNSFEEYVGILTIEDVLEQIVGRPIIDEFDQHENMRAVAARFARAEHQIHERKLTSEPSEVIE